MDAKKADKIISRIENHEKEFTAMFKKVTKNIEMGIRETKLYSDFDWENFNARLQWIKPIFEEKGYQVYTIDPEEDEMGQPKVGYTMWVRVPKFDCNEENVDVKDPYSWMMNIKIINPYI